MTIKPTTLALLLATAVLTACAAVTGDDGHSVAYLDGCYSGYADASRAGWELMYSKSDKYKTDPAYRKDWDKGYKSCFEEEERTPWSPGSSL